LDMSSGADCARVPLASRFGRLNNSSAGTLKARDPLALCWPFSFGAMALGSSGSDVGVASPNVKGKRVLT
jgi:hypothetical protein